VATSGWLQSELIGFMPITPCSKNGSLCATGDGDDGKDGEMTDSSQTPEGFDPNSLYPESEPEGAAKPNSLYPEDEPEGAAKPNSLYPEDEPEGAAKPNSLYPEDEPGA
jgi:hypothetical protein